MAMMGFKKGEGLGRRGEGRTEAIEDKGNIGSLGLGYAVKGLTDTASGLPEPLAPEEEVECPEPEWMEACALPLPELAEMAGWSSPWTAPSTLSEDSAHLPPSTV